MSRLALPQKTHIVFMKGSLLVCGSLLFFTTWEVILFFFLFFTARGLSSFFYTHALLPDLNLEWPKLWWWHDLSLVEICCPVQRDDFILKTDICKEDISLFSKLTDMYCWKIVESNKMYVTHYTYQLWSFFGFNQANHGYCLICIFCQAF